LATGLQVVVLVPGWHVSQGFAGFAAPEGWTLPPMSHCVPHAPPEQTCPLPQTVPFAIALHADVLVPGWQLWHASVGFTPAAP
jgi:hypothetical protein